MRSQLSSSELDLLLKRPHRTRLYMLVDRPLSVFTAQVNGAHSVGSRSISFKNGSGDSLGVKSGMTLLIGSSAGSRDLGIIRVKAISGTTTGTLTVAENSFAWPADAYLTILPEFRLWSVYPRVTYSGGVVDWFKDYDINYDANVL